MKTELIISENPRASLYGEPERVRSIDVTCCLHQIRMLYQMAENVQQGADGDAAAIMAALIAGIHAVTGDI